MYTETNGTQEGYPKQLVVRDDQGQIFRVTDDDVSEEVDIIAVRDFDSATGDVGDWFYLDQDIASLEHKLLVGKDFPPELVMHFGYLGVAKIVFVTSKYEWYVLNSDLREEEIIKVVIEECEKLLESIIIIQA